MHWKIVGRNTQDDGDVPQFFPIISQVTEDTVDNGLIAIYYGKKLFDGYGGYLREVTLFFKDEHLRKYKYFDGIYRLIRRIFYGRIVDIETFYVHVNSGKVDYCEFPKIYSGNHDIYADHIHLDARKPYPKHPIMNWANSYVDSDGGGDVSFSKDVFDYLSPYIYVNTSNHAMATHDTNSVLSKTLYRSVAKKSRWQRNSSVLKIIFLTRKQVDKKYQRKG